MFVVILLVVMGWSVVGAIVNLSEVGWSLGYLAQNPLDLLVALAVMAGGVLLALHLGLV